MDGKRLEEIMQSHGVINVTYNGLPVWIEGMRGDMAEVTFIGADRRLDVPIGELSEDDRDGGPFQNPLENDLI